MSEAALSSVSFFLLTLLFLPVLACVDPPDPVWMPGVYDAADYDEVVRVITDASTTDRSVPPTAVRPLVVIAGVLARAAPSRPSAVIPLPFSPRSPPIA